MSIEYEKRAGVEYEYEYEKMVEETSKIGAGKL